MSLYELLAECAAQRGAAPAILAPRRPTLTYAGLLEQVTSTVASLNALGLGRGDRVVVSLPPGPEWPTALAATISGFVCAPMNPEYSDAECRALLERTRAAALVTSVDRVPGAVAAASALGVPVLALEPVRGAEAGRFLIHGPRVAGSGRHGMAEDDDLAAIFATSGTTAEPKLIPLTQEMVCSRARRARRYVEMEASDRCLDLMPSFHGGGLFISVLGVLCAGGSAVYPGTVTIQDLEARIVDLAATWCALPPPMLEALAASDHAWSAGSPPAGFRAFFTCGAPLAATTAETLELRFGVPVQNSYGATECGGVAALPMPPGPRKKGSVGVSIGLDLAVWDDAGEPVAPGAVGELVVRGEGVFAGYDEVGDRVPPARPLEWHRTGDLARIDGDGFLFLSGRTGEGINRGGEKVSPEEVEAALRAHPAVARAVAFPVSHPRLGQDVAAAVVARTPDVDAAALRTFVVGRLAPFKVPRSIIIVPEIPTEPSGKVVRRSLAARFGRELSDAKERAASTDSPRDTIERGLVDIWSQILNLQSVGIRDRFPDVGGDSLAVVTMLAEVERSFGRRVPLPAFWNAPTIEALARLVMTADYVDDSLLVPVHASGSRPPLFVVLPGWFVPEVERLSQYLPPDQPIFALVPDPRPGAGQEGDDAPAIVRQCVAAIERVHPTGPCAILGRSVAGVVACEMARQLGLNGRTVTMVGLLDTHYPGVTRHQLLPMPLRQLEYVLGELVMQPRSRWILHLMRLQMRAFRDWRRGSRPRLPADAALVTGLSRLFTEAPAPVAARLVLFAAEDSRHRGFLDRRLYWSRVALDGFEVCLVPGNHNTMCQEPNVGAFGAALGASLTRADALAAGPRGA